MALITRISRLFTADVHAVLDRIEEPDAVLRQAVREMADEVARAEQQLDHLDARARELTSHQQELTEQIATLNSELDLCFEAGEEALARSLVKRKLTACSLLQSASRALESNQREHAELSGRVEEQRQVLAETEQKAELLVRTETSRPDTADIQISQDAIDVAFLKEQQRRQS